MIKDAEVRSSNSTGTVLLVLLVLLVAVNTILQTLIVIKLGSTAEASAEASSSLSNTLSAASESITKQGSLGLRSIVTPVMDFIVDPTTDTASNLVVGIASLGIFMEESGRSLSDEVIDTIRAANVGKIAKAFLRLQEKYDPESKVYELFFSDLTAVFMNKFALLDTEEMFGTPSSNAVIGGPVASLVDFITRSLEPEGLKAVAQVVRKLAAIDGSSAWGAAFQHNRTDDLLGSQFFEKAFCNPVYNGNGPLDYTLNCTLHFGRRADCQNGCYSELTTLADIIEPTK